MTGYHSLHINCGGESVNISDNSENYFYERDEDAGSASRYYVSETNWGYSSAGNYMDNDKKSQKYTISNSSDLSMDHPELYVTARIAPVSLVYYGFCLKNGRYTVKLHFAEIEITDQKLYCSLGQRIFDIYIQVMDYEYSKTCFFDIEEAFFILEPFDSEEVRMDGFQYHGRSKWNW